MENYLEEQQKLITYGRGSGNTTRQVDWIIDKLFRNLGENILVADHWDLFAYSDANTSRHLLDKVTNRLRNEFKIQPETTSYHKYKYIISEVKTFRGTSYSPDLESFMKERNKHFYFIRLQKTNEKK